MARYRCDVCKAYEYEESKGDPSVNIKPGTKPADFPDSWRCPICQSDKVYLQPIVEEPPVSPQPQQETIVAAVDAEKPDIPSSSEEWRRDSDELEIHMADIHRISVTGKSIAAPMRTTKHVVSWDDVLIKGAQLARIPLGKDETVNTRTVVGPNAKQPLVIETPIYVTHMSFGALSREVKIALAKGSAAVGTAMCSGEGGILEDSLENAYKYIFEYVPNKYSVTDENLKRVDACN
ncbi:glutamate synthase-related protein [Pseudomonas sp.]|uniref:glutamate synthase-related protein n=1 Tax=Pseudomonas sp. TaxID=306 RepID=UPI003FA7305E